MERLQKIVSAAGIASRRKAEAMILEGRVTVNGQTIRKLGAKADPARDHIKVDGKLIRQFPAKTYVVLNKPRGVICSLSDPQGRVKVTDLVRTKEKLYPVGRLDFETEGLIILTNDGEFTRILTRAGEQIPKVYQAKVRGTLDVASLKRLRSGIRLPDGTQFARSKIYPIREANNSWYEVTLSQGKNLQIRRMFQAVGHPVMKLRRVAIGFLKDEKLDVGQYRRLTEHEVARLLRLGGSIGSSGHRAIERLMTR